MKLGGLSLLLIATVCLSPGCSLPPEASSLVAESPSRPVGTAASMAATAPTSLPATMPARATTAASTQPATEPAQKKIIWPLSQATARQVPKYSLRQLSEMFPAFEHRPHYLSGFNHLTLPMRYARLAGPGDAREGLAFSFLLSMSLDWAPGCYCARHAYFVFKRESDQMRSFTRQYDHRQIRRLLRKWWATHAVGGVLLRGPQGYGGVLEIFGRDGTMVFSKRYDPAAEYFELLGRMSVDAMDFLGYEATPALVEHLRTRRCMHPESIVDLGQAAFGKRLSDEVLGVYDRILQRDPDFGDVRAWLANLSWWRDRNDAKKAFQYGRSMLGYLTPMAISFFNARKCPDKSLSDRYDQWLDRAEELTGADSPALLTVRLQRAYRAGHVPDDLLRRAMAAAAEYPNYRWLLYWLARCHTRGRAGTYDDDLAASLAVAALRARYMCGTRDISTPAQLAMATRDLGRNDIAAQILLDYSRPKKGGEWDAWSFGCLLLVLKDMGRYDLSVKHFLAGRDSVNREASPDYQYLVQGTIASAIAGRNDVVKLVLFWHRKTLAESKMAFLIRAYHDVAEGKEVDLKQIYDRSRKALKGWNHRETVAFCAQVDLLRGRQDYRKSVGEVLFNFPTWRPGWILWDLYERRNPSGESADFYEALSWLYGDDPWVQEAVADFRQRTPNPAPPDLERIRRLVKEFDQTPPAASGPARSQPTTGQAAASQPIRAKPFNKQAWRLLRKIRPHPAAAAVKKLLDEERFDEAVALTGDLKELADASTDYHSGVFYNHLHHLSRRACSNHRNLWREALPPFEADEGRAAHGQR